MVQQLLSCVFLVAVVCIRGACRRDSVILEAQQALSARLLGSPAALRSGNAAITASVIAALEIAVADSVLEIEMSASSHADLCVLLLLLLLFLFFVLLSYGGGKLPAKRWTFCLTEKLAVLIEQR